MYQSDGVTVDHNTAGVSQTGIAIVGNKANVLDNTVFDSLVFDGVLLQGNDNSATGNHITRSDRAAVVISGNSNTVQQEVINDATIGILTIAATGTTIGINTFFNTPVQRQDAALSATRFNTLVQTRTTAPSAQPGRLRRTDKGAAATADGCYHRKLGSIRQRLANLLNRLCVEGGLLPRLMSAECRERSYPPRRAGLVQLAGPSTSREAFLLTIPLAFDKVRVIGFSSCAASTSNRARGSNDA